MSSIVTNAGMKAFVPVICIDFDGVIHDYKKGWQDGRIYGDIVPGFFEWADRAALVFRLVVYSSRSATGEGLEAMESWMVERRDAWRRAHPEVPGPFASFEYAHHKPPAWITIDDRAIPFRGDWNAQELDPTALQAFRPWNAPPKPEPAGKPPVP